MIGAFREMFDHRWRNVSVQQASMKIADRLKTLRIGHGLRERLLLSFIAISGFAVAAAVVGNYAFYAIGQSLHQVTDQSVPPAIATLELAQRAERIIAAGPALLGVANSEEFTAVSSALDREVKEAGRQQSELRDQGLTVEKLIQIRLIFRVVTANLESLKSAVQARIAAVDRKSALVGDTFDAYNQFRTLWTPKFNELKGHILTLQRALDDPRSAPEERLAAFARLNAAISDLAPLEQIQQEAAVTFEALVRASRAATPAELDSIRAHAEEAVRHIDDLVSGLDPDVSFALIVPLSRLRISAIGNSSIMAARQVELNAAQEGRRLTVENADLSVQLGNAVESLVAASKQNIATATKRTQSVEDFGRLGLAVVVALSLISSVLVGWLYVGRNVVARLTMLSDGMRAIVGGRRDITIPAGGRDEIAEMARAVEVFRDNAIALDQLLAEREQAAAHLEKVYGRGYGGGGGDDSGYDADGYSGGSYSHRGRGGYADSAPAYRSSPPTPAYRAPSPPAPVNVKGQSPASSCLLVVYQEPDFAGQYWKTSEDQQVLDPDWNKTVQSIKVLSGTWELFDQDDYSGSGVTLEPGSYNELGDDWTGQISSFRCVK